MDGLWYNAQVPIWLERFALPVCVALVVSLTILNPLKMDWQQRVSLALTITALAYFIGHSLHRTGSSKVGTDDSNKFSVLEQQMEHLTEKNKEILQSRQEEVNALKQQLEDYKAQVIEKKKKAAIREQLATFLAEGDKLRQQCLTEISAPAPAKEANDWATRVNDYLIKNLERSYSARFIGSPSPVPISHTNVPE